MVTQPVEGLSMDQIIAMMVGRSLSQRFPDRISVPGEVMLEVRNLTSLRQPSIRDISFDLHQGEILAIGGNPEAAKVSGVNVPLNLIMIYALSGIFYTFGGMLEAGRIGSATNNLGFMYELDAIAACVVGGVSFAVGVGTVLGGGAGVIIFTVINYGLTYIGVNPYWQYIIKGAIIIFAVALDLLKTRRKSSLCPTPGPRNRVGQARASPGAR